MTPEYITITWGGKQNKGLEFRVGNILNEELLTGAIKQYCGQYFIPDGKHLSFNRSVYIYGLGEEFNNWLWVILHETLHDCLSMFLREEINYWEKSGVDQQEYIIDLILKDMGFG